MSVDLHQLEKDLKLLADLMAERYKKTQDAYTATRIAASELVKKAEKKVDAFVEEAERARRQAARNVSDADEALAGIQRLVENLEKEQS